MANDEPSPRLSLSALSLPDTAKLLTKTGGQPVSINDLEADISDGAPVNPDGTLNLVQYAAWLVKDVAQLAGR